MKIMPVALLVTALTFTCAATAAITDVAGSVKRIRAPASVERGVLESNTEIVVFREVQESTLISDVFVNATAPGFYDATGMPVTEFIPAGTVVDSYLLHFDPIGQPGPDPVSLGGTISFSGTIIGVIFKTNELLLSDAELGAHGTIYGDAISRGLETSGPDFFTIAPDAKDITVLFNARGVFDEVRIITMHSPVNPSGLEGVSD